MATTTATASGCRECRTAGDAVVDFPSPGVSLCRRCLTDAGRTGFAGRCQSCQSRCSGSLLWYPTADVYLCTDCRDDAVARGESA